MVAGVNADHWAVARDAGAPITVHVNGTNQLLPVADAMRSKVFIGGQLKKSQGKLVGVDMNRITRLLNQSRDYIVSKSGLG